MRNVLIVFMILCLVGIVLYTFWKESIVFPTDSYREDMVPLTPAAVSPSSGGMRHVWNQSFAGVGWSINPRTTKAIDEAVSHALGKKQLPPDITFVYYNPQHDPKQIIKTLRKRSRSVGRIFGETTHEGILSFDGYHVSPTGVLGLLSMRDSQISFGVGAASFGDHSPAEATKKALADARYDAGSEFADQKPSMVLLNVTLPHEEEVLSELAKALGPEVPVFGGTAAGSMDGLSRKSVSNWSIIVNDQTFHDGVGIAVVYSKKILASAYGGGFRRTTLSGTITKAEPRLILEIDGRPALDVYDEWLGGRIREAMARGKNIAKFCSLYPISRILGDDQSQFIRVWPTEDPDWPGSLKTGSDVTEGDKIFLNEGNWNMLLNYFGTIPQRAQESFVEFDTGAGLLFYCGGALAGIPNPARKHMNVLVNHALGKVPWIGVFTWGEQGTIPGVGNFHSNVSSGTVLFPIHEPKAKPNRQ